MACDCKSKIEEKLLARVQEALPDSTEHKVELKGYSFVFGDGNSIRLNGCMDAEIQHKIIVKKTGLPRLKKEKQSFVFTYCPFCGVKYKPDEETT